MTLVLSVFVLVLAWQTLTLDIIHLKFGIYIATKQATFTIKGDNSIFSRILPLFLLRFFARFFHYPTPAA